MEMVALRSQEGVDFVVPAEEARVSMFLRRRMELDRENYIVPADGDETKYTHILLRSIRADVLPKVLHYCKRHAIATDDDRDLGDWDAEFVGSVDLDTLYDLILASEKLEVRGLLGLACRALAGKIKGKSPRETCHILDVRGVFDDANHDLKLVEKALAALNIVRCQDFTQYEPKLNAFKCSRYHNFENLAFFDFDKESSFQRGPPLHKLPSPESIQRYCLNVISVKARESDVGYPISVFGTVIARDYVDYRCVYLFRRERDDPQLISSPDDMLSLVDPCRALVPIDNVYFETDLKIKCDGGADRVFSKGITEFNWVCIPTYKQTMAVSVYSFLSDMEFLCALVHEPVEATIAINVLKGPCNISRVAASAPGNFKDHVVLYESAGSPTVVGDGDSIPLTRSVVAISLDQKLALFLVGGDACEHLALTLGHSDQVLIRKMGCAVLEM
uniref:SKP1-like protein 1B n=1 Tax=Aegilops tauschii TaxID=37682 RepID=M8BC34_AEGTA